MIRLWVNFERGGTGNHVGCQLMEDNDIMNGRQIWMNEA